MSNIKRIVKKTKEHLVHDGIKDTTFLVVRFLMRHIYVQINNKSEYKISAKERQHLTPKKSPTVYIVAGVPYYDIGGGQRCAQLAKTFNKMGYSVEFLYAILSGHKKEKNVWLPVKIHAFVDEKILEYVKGNVQKDDIFVFEAPIKQMEPLIDIAVENECRIVYENIDNWETSLGSAFFDENLLVKFLTKAHVLVGTAKPLVDQLYHYLEKYNIQKEEKQILYLANAVDEELFCGAKQCNLPEDFVQGEKTLLYYGTLNGEWFAWDLVLGIAKRHPEYAINLIGNTEGIKKIINDAPKNVHFLGPKKQAELPAYSQYSDFTLIPFKRGEIGDYVSPLKIFEYISMYKRVITTSLPDIEGYPNVYFGDTVEEWEQIIQNEAVVDKEAADAFIDENTWFHRISMMLQTLDVEHESTVLKDKLSIVILNYNNKNVIFKCVNSLLRYQARYNYEIIVVDNGSTDGSFEMLQERYSAGEILLCRNEKNGCSSGRNLGVTKATREYVMFLDSDQWVTNPYWLKAYEEIIEIHPDFGCIGWAAGFFNPSGVAGHIVDFYPNRHMPPQMLCRTDIGYLGSGGMLMRIEDFKNIEGFDVAYDPTCYEDTDISLKMRNYGKQLYYCPYLGVIHLPHQTTNAGSEEHKNLANQKRDYFTNKWKKINPKLLKYLK